MKKIIMCFFFFSVILVGCGNVSKEPIADFDTSKIAAGVIETRSNVAKSRIIFFDEKLNQLGELPINYANVGIIEDTPVVKNHSIYVIPQGYLGKKDEMTALEIGLGDLHINEFAVEQVAIDNIEANDNYIYTSNNLNGVASVCRIDRKTGGTKLLNIRNDYVDNIFCENDKVYVFATDLAQGDGVSASYLYVFDEKLVPQTQYDISDCGASHGKAIEYRGDIYFSNYVNKEDEYSSFMGKLNARTNKIELIDLGHDYMGDIVTYHEKLYIAHYDIQNNSDQDGGITIYNPSNGKTKYVPLKHGVEQMQIRKDKMFIMSDRCLYIYDIKTMTCDKKVDVEKQNGKTTYLSEMFTVTK